MKKTGMRAVLAAGMLWGLVLPLQAGIGDADGHTGETLVITNTISSSGNYYVGYSGANNTLIVTNGGDLVGISRLYIGSQAGSTGNLAHVTGAGSSITNSDIIFIGEYDGGNTLIIDDGARVRSGNRVQIGHRINADNVAIIDGGTWEQGRLELGGGYEAGEETYNNRMIITNGGKVFTGSVGTGSGREGFAFIGNNTRTFSNAVLVTGAGSFWGITNSLEVGRSGSSFNTLTIEHGGVVSNASFAHIGASGTNNSVLVTGTNSHWHAGSELQVGRFADATANTLTVTDDGLVTVWGDVTVGTSGGSLSNRLVLTTNDLAMWGTRGALEIDGGTVQDVALLTLGGTSNRMVVSNDGYINIVTNHPLMSGTAGLLLIESGGVLTNASRGENFRISGDRNRVVVDGDGSTLGLSQNFWMTSGSDNLLLVTNQGQVFVEAIVMSSGSTASNNALLVTGGGSRYDGNHILLGRQGHGNWVRVEDGGAISSTYIYINENTGASNNALVVTGEGSTLTSSSALGIQVGRAGSGATMTVEDGASVVSVNAYVGQSATSADNLAVITGDGTTWTNTGTFFVGTAGGANNRLRVEDGALLESGSTQVGADGTLEMDAATVRGNVTVDAGGVLEGAGTIDGQVQLSGTLQSGAAAGPLTITDYLRIADGGLVTAELTLQERLRMWGDGETGTLGAGADVELTQSSIRMDGTGNDLWVQDGAKVSVTHTTASQIEMAGSENRLMITGNGSEVALERHIYQGGSDNAVVATNGGALELWALVLSSATNNSGNLVQVTGAGSTYSGQHLLLGREGYDNEVRVDDGGTLAATYAYISERAVASNNTLLVTGSGSSATFSDATGLHVGYEGSRAEMTVSDGATLRSVVTYIGYGEASAGNVATITGAGSAWTNTGTIFVGYGGAVGNQLRVHDGALLESDTIEVGAGGMLELSNVTVYVMAESNPFVVQDGGLLRGAGTIEAEDFMNPPDDPFFIDGTVSPGFSTGTLGFGGDLTLGANAVVVMEIAGEEDFDQLTVFDPWATGVYGNLTFNGTLQLSLLGDYEPKLDDSFQLFVADSYLDIEKMLIDDTDAPLQETWWSWQLNPDGSVSVIPEAATTGSMLLGLALLAALRRRGRM